jgi:hypothetical protein
MEALIRESRFTGPPDYNHHQEWREVHRYLLFLELGSE